MVEDVIELTDIVEEENIGLDLDSVEDGNINFDLDIVQEESFEVEETLEPKADISFNEGLELGIEDTPDDDLVETEETVAAAGELDVSQEQIEAALERVIEKKFGERIEILLFEVIEKVIEKEIVEIRESLQKDLDQIGNV
ncbi:MAG: hypothetical protein KKE44_05545 [Proteobacteria bacterium]|nr:hypothetical protein [Pseudomonadota bacterium]MBU1582195.1 hypothetical protein [Pseudomonadota bacterium]MBU2451769.1 hypothetical protein [Pseudomonadota bacterium]MBU2627120.1 hypothetical protein [Pseudomonadota bacterium]